jgi:hypothetical protein
LIILYMSLMIIYVVNSMYDILGWSMDGSEFGNS